MPISDFIFLANFKSALFCNMAKHPYESNVLYRVAVIISACSNSKSTIQNFIISSFIYCLLVGRTGIAAVLLGRTHPGALDSLRVAMKLIGMGVTTEIATK